MRISPCLKLISDLTLLIQLICPLFLPLILSCVDFQPRKTIDDVVEERDSEYDAMLSKMVGRIQTKPGGKLETGEVS